MLFLSKGITQELYNYIKKAFLNSEDHNSNVELGRKIGVYGSKYSWSCYGNKPYPNWEVIKGWGDESELFALPVKEVDNFLYQFETEELYCFIIEMYREIKYDLDKMDSMFYENMIKKILEYGLLKSIK